MAKNDTTGTTGGKRRLGRREVVGGIAMAAGGAVAARLTDAREAQAADGQAILQGTAGDAQNVASTRTTLKSAAIAFPNEEILVVDARPDTSGSTAALTAYGAGIADGADVFGGANGGLGMYVLGGASSGVGMQVLGGAPNGAAVQAFSVGFGQAVTGQDGAYGTVGYGSAAGAYGKAVNPGPASTNPVQGIGVFGQVEFAGQAGVLGEAPLGTGVEGRSGSAWDVGATAGVRGVNTGDGAAVAGIANNGIGVFGYNTGSGDGDPAACGGFFTTTANNTNAMVAQVFPNVTNAAAFLGVASGAGNIAGYFVGETRFNGPMAHTGNVNITGALTVSGAKNAVVPMADGSLHRVYSMESPECWFEDFGEAELQGNAAFVPFPGDFAQLVDTSSYHVFLTPIGEPVTLSVRQKNAAGFTVAASGRGASAFSYRIVARRKDIATSRLEAFTPPAEAKIRVPSVDAVLRPPVRSVVIEGSGAPPPSPSPRPASRGKKVTAPSGPAASPAPAPRGR